MKEETITNEGKTEGPKVEVSAATITRMMGIATLTDIKLIDGKLDLLSTKLNTLTAKVERLTTMLSSAPNASDIDRLDIQVGSVKTLVREVLAAVSDVSNQAGDAAASAEQSRKLRAGIKTNSAEEEKGS